MSTKPEQVTHFYCGDCGPHVAADEDGLCGQCGGDTVVQACCSGHDVAANPPSAEELAERLTQAGDGDEEILHCLISYAEMVADEPLGGTDDLPAAKRILADVLRGG